MSNQTLTTNRSYGLTHMPVFMEVSQIALGEKLPISSTEDHIFYTGAPRTN